MTIAFALLFAAAAVNATPPAAPVTCGGSYAGEDLKFSVNPINGVHTAFSKGEDLMLFIDSKTDGRVRVNYAHAVSEAEWAKLEAARGAPGGELYDLLSRLGSAYVTEIWTGFTKDGYVHFVVKQRDLQFSFSCTRGDVAVPTEEPFDPASKAKRHTMNTSPLAGRLANAGFPAR